MIRQPLLVAYAWKWGLTFRIRGRGMSIIYDHPPLILFSERYGLRKVWRAWRFKVIFIEAPKPPAFPPRPINPYRVPHKDRYL